MTVELIVLDVAEEELAEAEAWYEAQRAGLGGLFLSAVSAAIERVQAFPEAASPAPGTSSDLGARSVRVRKFPYSVVFCREGGVVWVVAFAHEKRRPGYWRTRAKP